MGLSRPAPGIPNCNLLPLVTSSLVALRGLGRTMHANFGFDPKGVTMAVVDLQLAGYSGPSAEQFQKHLADEVSHLPGVTEVGYASATPLDIYTSNTAVFAANAAEFSVKNRKFMTPYFKVSPGYLPAAATRILVGRNFTRQDDAKTPRVAIINQTFAEKLFGTENVVGRYMKIFGNKTEIVGVVENGKYALVSEDPTPALFVPIYQMQNEQMCLLVRSNRDSNQLAPAIHDVIRRLDPNLPISSLGSWQDALAIMLLPSHAATAALAVFGGLGILLAVTGIFGLASYTVSRRMKELGIRVALGASHGQVLRAALQRPVILLAFGSFAGLVSGILASRILASIVYQATPNDPLVLFGVALTMLVVGVLATWIPARRVLHVEPTNVLHDE
ncbi:MAG: FtsX-like permease family protein [Acidobacteriaceae bacterium]